MKGFTRKVFALMITLVLFSALILAVGEVKEAAATEEEKQITIGYATRELTAAFSRAAVLGAQKKADELGVKLIVLSSDNDDLRHLGIMDDFITMKIDGFIHAGSLDTKGVVAGVKRMNEAGIPITALDNCPDGGKVDYFMSFDKVKSSARATETMIQELKNRHGGKVPKGVAIEVMGDLKANFAMECTKGFHSVIDQYKQLKVVQGIGNWNNEDAFKVTSDFLTRFGDEVVAVYVHTPDIMGIGAVNAIKQAGMDPKKIPTAGICLGPEGRDLIKKGVFTAIVAQPIYIAGEMCVDLLYKMIKGQPVPKIGDTIVKEGELWSPARVLDNPGPAEGAYIALSAPLVPQEILPDDPRLWENKVALP